MTGLTLWRVWHGHGFQRGQLVLASSADRAMGLARARHPSARALQPVAREGADGDSVRDLSDRRAAALAVAADHMEPGAEFAACEFRVGPHGEVSYMRIPENRRPMPGPNPDEGLPWWAL